MTFTPTPSAQVVRPAAGGGRKSPPARRSSVPLWWVIPGGLLVLLFQFVATAFGGVYAFTEWNGIGTAEFVGFDNFVEIIQRPELFLALGNTFVIGVLYVVGTNAIGLGLALLLNRTLKSRHVLRTLLFIPTVMSTLAVSYIWLFIFQYNGPLNGLLDAIGMPEAKRVWVADPQFAIWTIVVVSVWQSVGIPMIIYLAGLANVPVELEEAAVLDGASVWKRFRYVTIPLLRPAIFMSSMLSMIQGLRVFDPIIALTGGGPVGATETLATQVYKQTFAQGHFGLGAALSVMLTLIILAIAVLQFAAQRREN